MNVDFALPGAEWRPGFARRANNFGEVCEVARAWTPIPGLSVGRISSAVLKGTPMLSPPERNVLLMLVEHLNEDRLEEGVAAVWPSAKLVARYFDCSQAQIRKHRASLEAKGFIVRDYTPANRPAGVLAYNLAPLIAQLVALEAHADTVREQMRAEREAYASPIVHSVFGIARAPGFLHLEQTSHNTSYAVTENATATPRESGAKHPATQASRGENGQVSRPSTKTQGNRQGGAFGSARRATSSAGTSPDPIVRAEMIRQELEVAVKICPQISGLVTPRLLDNPLAGAPETAEALARLAAQILPDPDRNNDQTAMWGWRSHGARTITMLAIALADPQVLSPNRYFGRLVSSGSDALDLRLNLQRLLRSGATVAGREDVGFGREVPPLASEASAARPPAETPVAGAASPPLPRTIVWTPAEPASAPIVVDAGGQNEPWPALAVELRKILGGGKFGAWFSRVQFVHLVDAELAITAPPTAAEWIRNNAGPALIEAAEVLGLEVRRIVVGHIARQAE